MGSFLFKWDHPASEVYVTGTFDDWSKSEKLEKSGEVFEKDVTLSSAGEKIYYKFVVDGNWITDHTAPQENDASGNLNNVLTTDRISKHTPETVGIMAGVAPTSTTAELAKNVPLEKAPFEHTGSAELPGAYPETPAAAENTEFSVNPLPAADGAVNPIYLEPGEKIPEKTSSNGHTITSNVHDDPELVATDNEKNEPIEAEPTFSVAPLPAFEGAVNPTKVEAGEKIPHESTLTTNTLTSGVHDDPELVAADQAKSEAEPTVGVAPLPAFEGAINPIKLAPGEDVPHESTLTTNTLTSGVHDDPELVAADKEKGESGQIFSVSPLPAFAGAVNPIKLAPGEGIPQESTLTGNTITSAVHLDKASYEKSDALAPVLPPVVTPQSERDQNGTGILDLPPISSGLIPESSLPIGATGVGTFDASPTIQSSGPGSTTFQLASNVPLESTKVPDIVKESQEEAGVAPEASAIPEEVKEKSAVEKELLSEVPTVPSTSEGTGGQGTDKTENTVSPGEAAAAVGGAAVALSAAAASGAAIAASKVPESVTSKLPESVQTSINSINAQPTSQSTATATDTPEIVKESIAESGQSPEAAGNEEAVLEKKAVEKELLSEVKPEMSTGESAPKLTASANTPGGLTTPEPSAAAIDSRDVSPRTVPGSHTQAQTKPVVTTGITSVPTATKTVADTPSKSAAPETPATPAPVSSSSTPSSSKATDSPATVAADKKKKRASIFGRIKAKFSDKHKD